MSIAGDLAESPLTLCLNNFTTKGTQLMAIYKDHYQNYFHTTQDGSNKEQNDYIKSNVEELFTMNKYTKWYLSIISNRINNNLPKNIYGEKHHIIPKSLGGCNNSYNLIKLSAKEHFVVHLLLTKMCKEKLHERKMCFALHKMSYNPQSPLRENMTSTEFELVRIKNQKALTGRKFTESHKRNLSNANKGKKRSKETRELLSISAKRKVGEKNPFFGKSHSGDTRQKISLSNKGKKRTEEVKRLISKNNTGEKNPFFGKSHSEETKKTISEKAKSREPRTGWKHSEETKKKLSEQTRKSRLGKIYINNGMINKLIDANDQIPSGWVRGRRKN